MEIWINFSKAGELIIVVVLLFLSSVISVYLGIRIYQLKKKQAESNKVINLALKGSKIGLWDWSIKSDIVRRSKGYGELLGYVDNELNGEPIFQSKFMHKDDIPRLKAALTDYLHGNTNKYEVEYRLKAKSGLWRWVLDRGITVSYDSRKNPVRVMGITIDITKRKEAEEKIKQFSFTDTLTGLHNRAFFNKELHKLDNEEALPLSIVLGDINGLKLANDTFGHQAGDKLLINVTDLLRNAFRKKDIITRWGGDEFAIILPNTSKEVALEICDHIRETCANAKADPIQPSIALGVATRETSEQPLSSVIKHAEDWMYQHKLLENTSASSALINSLVQTLQDKNPESKEHSLRVETLALKMGKALNLAPNQLDELSLLAILHDIGKIILPEEIIRKKRPLTIEEEKEMKKHPEAGYRIAKSLPQLSSIADAILAHHERWDGTGYPNGLKGERIPLTTRIIAIVDAYDRMVYLNSHGQNMTKEQAIWELKKYAGTKYDPQLVSVFREII